MLDYSLPQFSLSDLSPWLESDASFSSEPDSFELLSGLTTPYDSILGGPCQPLSPLPFDGDLATLPELDAADLFLAEVEERAKQAPQPAPISMPHIPGEFDEFASAVGMDFSSDEAAASSDEEMHDS